MARRQRRRDHTSKQPYISSSQQSFPLFFSFFLQAYFIMSLANVLQTTTAICAAIQVVYAFGKVLCTLPRVRRWLVEHHLRDPQDFDRRNPELAIPEDTDRTTPESLARTDNRNTHPLDEVVVGSGRPVETSAPWTSQLSRRAPSFSTFAPPVRPQLSVSALADRMATLHVSRSSSQETFFTADPASVSSSSRDRPRSPSPPRRAPTPSLS